MHFEFINYFGFMFENIDQFVQAKSLLLSLFIVSQR